MASWQQSMFCASVALAMIGFFAYARVLVLQESPQNRLDIVTNTFEL